MKHVFSDISDIAHLWANKQQDNARNSGNFYFEGNCIYSYGRHFMIAKHVVNDRGENAVLFTERKYSVTTSSHISVVRQAANHLNIIYCFNPDSTHEQNFNSWKFEVENTAVALLKAKKPEKYLSEIENIKSKAEKYAAYFDLEIPAGLLAAFQITNKEQYKAYNDNKEAIKQAEEQRAKELLKKRHKKELTDWLKGKTHRLYVRDGYDYLRLQNDRVETTQAVQIPIKTAIALYQKIKDNELKAGDSFMSYEVLNVGKEVKIGCHNFKTPYLLQFGSKLAI